MSSLTSTLPATTYQAPCNSTTHWITPEKQLEQLALPAAKKISDCVPSLISVLANLVATYALDEWLTNWYTAYDRLNSLPSRIPPLPDNISQIMYKKCPIYGDKVTGDGESCLVKDTHFLALISEGLGSLNYMENNVLIPYGRDKYQEKDNPFQFRFFWPVARHEHGNTPFSATHFVLMTNDVLRESRLQKWDKLATLVDQLSEKAGVKYEIPTLSQSCIAIITDMVATGKQRYSTGTAEGYTFVQEKADGLRLVVGGIDSDGMRITHELTLNLETTGSAVVQKFSGIYTDPK